MTRNEKILIAVVTLVWLLAALATIVWDDAASNTCFTDTTRLAKCE